LDIKHHHRSLITTKEKSVKRNKTLDTIDTLDTALFQLRQAREILADAEHSAASAKAIGEVMHAPIETMTDCLEDLLDKARDAPSSPRDTWDTWMEITRAVDDARGLVLLADLECAYSIGNGEDLENAHRALISASVGLLVKVAKLLPAIEPESSQEAA
jgi:hypothetical protein